MVTRAAARLIAMHKPQQWLRQKARIAVAMAAQGVGALPIPGLIGLQSGQPLHKPVHSLQALSARPRSTNFEPDRPQARW